MAAPPTYEALVRTLFNVSRFSGMKLGLSNTERLAALLGSPHTRFRTVHVTGTNGKGSVSTKIAAGLQHSGRTVGLYTSPHISSFRERVSIDGELISEREVVTHLARVMELAAAHNIPATFFELTTLMAFSHFAQRNVDYAVVEVGIGGRLDATNIIQPDLAVLTSIGLDHCDILGPTVEHITREKSGIIKANAATVIGPTVPRDIVREACALTRSELTEIDGPFANYELENEAVSAAGLRALSRTLCARGEPGIGDDALARALLAVPPCRFEQHVVERAGDAWSTRLPASSSAIAASAFATAVHVILDVAHNPPAFAQLFRKLAEQHAGRPVRIVLGFSGEKDAGACLAVAGAYEHTRAIHLTRAPHERAATVARLEAAAAAQIAAGARVPVAPVLDGGEIVATMRHALAACAAADELLLVCGSFYILSDVRRALGMRDVVDTFDLHERTVGSGATSAAAAQLAASSATASAASSVSAPLS